MRRTCQVGGLLLKMLLLCVVMSGLPGPYAQNTVTFDVSAKKQMIKSLETWSEVNMWHSTMDPHEYDLMGDLNAHNYTMCLKSDVEQTNDNADPYVTNLAGFNPNVGGKAGHAMSRFFPFIRECKRIRDSMVTANPALKPFTLGIRAGYYDRYVPDWLKSTTPGTSQVDPDAYAEYAENIYYQCKTYKDSTGVDVTSIDPLNIDADIISYGGNIITPANLCRLLDTLGTYLDSRGMHPALGFGNMLSLGSGTNQATFLSYINRVFTDTTARKYVKNVNINFDLLFGLPSDAFYAQVADSSRKYGFDITIAYSYYGGRSETWQWTGNPFTFASTLARVYNVCSANKIMLQYHVNFETGTSVGMMQDTIGNGVAGLDDPSRESTRIKTEQYYLFGHLFRHTNAGSTYVVNSSSANANVLQTVLCDTVSGNTTILLVNRGTSANSIRLSGGAYDPGTYDVYRCSVTEIDIHLAPVVSSALITLPAQSATVLTGSGGSVGAVFGNAPVGGHQFRRLAVNRIVLTAPGQVCNARTVTSLTGKRISCGVKRAAVQVLILRK